MPADMTRRGALGAIAAAALISRRSHADDTIAPDDPRVTVEGRTAVVDGALRIGFPGVSLRFTADAPSAAVRLTSLGNTAPGNHGPENWIDVFVDDGPPRVVSLAPGSQDLILYENKPGRHRVEIVRRTESWQGVLAIDGWTVAGPIAPIPSPGRRLMFIGDSITCGAGLDAARDSTVEGTRTSDASRAFGRLLARRLDAACHLVSYGGRGIIRDWQGIRDINNAPVFYERALPDDPARPWDPRRYVPDAIGICLGTNDFNQGIPEQYEFVNAYVEFVRKARRDAPDAHVFLLDSPMTEDGAKGPHRTVLGAYLDETVARLGEPRVHRAPVRHYAGRASNSHPIYEDHVAIADEIEPRFREALGWT